MPPTSAGFVSFLRRRRSFTKSPKNARARTPSGTPTPAPTAVIELAKWIFSASVAPEHWVLSEVVLSEQTPSVGVVAPGSDDVGSGDDPVSDAEGVEVGKDDVVCEDDSVVVEDLGNIFTATPGLILKSLPSSALHVFSRGLPHQKFLGLSAPTPSVHG